MRRHLSPAALIVVLGTALLALAPLAGPGSPRTREFVGDLGPAVLGLAATLAALGLSGHPGFDRDHQRAWRRLALAFGCWWLGDVMWFVTEAVLHRHPFPSPADAAYLAFYPCAAWALLSFPSATRRRRDWTTLGLDALTVLGCAAMGIWYLVVGPTVHDHPGQGLAMVLGIAYPVGDLVVLFGVLINLFRRTAAMDRAFRLLMAGVLSLVVADIAFARLSLSGTYDGGWPDAFWLAAWCLFFLAADAARRGADRRRAGASGPGQSDGHPVMAGLGRPRPRRADQPLARLPYLAVALAYVLLLVVGHRAAVYPLDGLILGAAAVTAIVLVRQVNMIAENGRLMARLQNLANVDALTGIPNRRAFFEEAELLFEGPGGLGGGHRRHSILMIDVDYFKDVNDTFGHRTGDRVLSVVAAAVKSQLRSADLVGRYGGDELVIALADCSGPAAVAVAERIRTIVAGTPIATDDGVVNVTLSIGLAGSEHGEGLLPILARADLALYDAKRAGRACVREFAAGGSVPTPN
ncbi:MAG TPA: GGDEF domain-containing protein [Acidimicrobiia bacterium]|nr:GGDEF domain-containing protein [Acidimicrobiia bacterium]